MSVDERVCDFDTCENRAVVIVANYKYPTVLIVCRDHRDWAIDSLWNGNDRIVIKGVLF